LLVVGEVVLGALMGFAASLVAEAAAAAGQLLDDLVGLRTSVPGIAVAPSGFGTLWSLVFLVGYFALGGVETVIVAFAESFRLFPLGTTIQTHAIRQLTAVFTATFVRLALELAAPAVTLSLVVHLTPAALVRVFPRLGTLTLSFPAAYAAVMLAAFTGLLWLRQLGAHPVARIWPLAGPS
ncbi:MAG: flagellar biosynthetic protein FliR, partial [Candidatus Eremiobacteraeota bacterium]|nr:flagellar biosynthetic protein FliR [Candidatus Eremiobacteraeota bacterium]MBV8354748.1 flagellar biosynthetic protein FliR [Candidatus Eremiobacteraeota bacterium]